MLELLRKLVSQPNLHLEAIRSGLAEIGFRDVNSALLRLQKTASLVLPADRSISSLFKLVRLLSETADLDAGLMHFERFVLRVTDRQELFHYLETHPRSLEVLVRLFACSRYLTDTIIRDPRLLRELTRHRYLAELKSREDFFKESLAQVDQCRDLESRLNVLRRYQRSELLRIGTCDAFGLIDLRAATVQLSLLAQGLVQACLRLISEELGNCPTDLTVLAFGKLGGEELNYSSDIDLVFLTDQNPIDVLPIAQQLVKALQDSTAEGFLYRVDVRLRPWGRSGELVTTVDSYLDYLTSHAEMWEKQALLKARVIAGSLKPGAELLTRSEPLIFGADPNEVRESVLKSKKQIETGLRRSGREWGAVKLGLGSIRDIEFVVQSLQLVHGNDHHHVRSANTLDALVRLTDVGLLQADEYRRLTEGYIFLRAIEHSLQLMNNRQEHSLPHDSRELTALARRMDFEDSNQFLCHFDSHRASIRTIYERHLNHERYLAQPIVTTRIHEKHSPVKLPFSKVPFDSYESTYSSQQRQWHRELLADVSESKPVIVSANKLDKEVLYDPAVSTQTLPQSWQVTVVGQDCPGELSMICGLMFAYGFDIIEGSVFTLPRTRIASSVRTFVDSFIVRSDIDSANAESWNSYEHELNQLVRLVKSGKIDEAQGNLVRRVAIALQLSTESVTPLAPLDVEIDNESDDRMTVLNIRGDETMGFLYELANALTMSGVAIEQVIIRTEQHRAWDTLLVTNDRTGEKILNSDRLEELRAAIVLIKHFTHLLPASPNPQAALVHFRSFLRDLFHRPDWLDQFSTLDRPDVLAALAQLLGVSDFLWEDFLRLQYANLFPVLQDIERLKHRIDRQELVTTLNANLMKEEILDRQRQVLNEFKDRELFRINMRHILNYCGGIETFGHEMTELAEVIIHSAAEFCYAELLSRYGEPKLIDGTTFPWVICGLGKCGGRELGSASDLELMFIYGNDPLSDVDPSLKEKGTFANHSPQNDEKTSDREPIDCASFFAKFVECVCQSIVSRAEGVFRIDLRLRPYGRAGSLAVSLDAFRNYFQVDGPAWPYERQALVKLRPIAGDQSLGQQISLVRDKIVYTGLPFDFSSISAMRERQLRQRVGTTEFNAKLSRGGLVDIEYLIQALQIEHGHLHSSIRSENTLTALDALTQYDVVSTRDRSRLSEAYEFLRCLIDALRMVHGDARALSVPKADSPDFDSLARRLGYQDKPQQLEQDLIRHTQAVIELVRLYSDKYSHPKAGNHGSF